MRAEAKRSSVANHGQGHLLAAGALAVLALFFSVFASQASAAPDTYVMVGEFVAERGSGPNQLEGLQKLDVDTDTGLIYVVDSTNNRIQVFEPDGDSVSRLTEITGLSSPYGIAIDQDASPISIYVSQAGSIVKLNSDGGAVPRFSVDGRFVSPPAGRANPGEIGNFQSSLAVDPTTGELLVADAGRSEVHRYDSDGTHIASFPVPKGALDIEGAPNGDVVVLDGNAGGGGEFSNRYDAGGTLLTTFGPVIQPFSMTFDPINGNTVFGAGSVSRPPNEIWTFTDTDFDPARTKLFSLMGARINGLAFNPRSGRLYGTVDVYHDPVTQPPRVIVLDPATRPAIVFEPIDAEDIGSMRVAATGTVNPEGTPTIVRLEYSRDGNEWLAGPPQEIGDGTTPVPIELEADGLLPKTRYQVRLIARNDAGTKLTVPQTIETSESAPLVEPRGAAPRTPTSARLNGLVNPVGLDTDYHFEYGSEDCDDTPCTPLPGGNAGDAFATKLVSAELTDLEPETTYHYRLVAENSVGETVHSGTFTTRALDDGPAARAIELINKPDKGNQDVRPVDLAPDRDEVLWVASGGVPGAPLGSASAFLANRTPQRWESTSLLPSVDRIPGRGDLRLDFINASSDFRRFIFDATVGFLSANPHLITRIGADGQIDELAELGPQTEAQRLIVSDDVQRVFITTRDQFHPSHRANVGNIYEIGGGRPELVSIMPGTREAPLCGVLSGSAGETGFGGTYYPWTSRDGSRIAFRSAGNECFASQQLYYRNLLTGTTTLISGPALTGELDEAKFIRLDERGTSVLFETKTVLDPDDGNNGRDVYRWTEGVGNECLTCVVPNAQVGGDLGTGGSNAVSSATADFSRIYFETPANLTPAAGTSSVRKLYVLRNGRIEYIAPYGHQGVDPGGMTPDGRVFVFPSSAAGVTADNNGGFEQYYRWDEAERSVECLSCPTLAPPTVNVGHQATDWGFLVNRARGAVAITRDGRSFVFQTAERLLHEDINKVDDIYEWKDGRVALVTDGETEFPVGGIGAGLTFQGMSPDGVNVLFTVAKRLTGHELDFNGNLYSARIGPGLPGPETPPAVCVEDSCQGPLVPAPALRQAATSDFAGAGNLTPSVDCGAQSRSAKRLSQKAKRLGRAAARTANPRRKAQLRRQAKRASRAAKQAGRRAKRCRQARASQGGAR